MAIPGLASTKEEFLVKIRELQKPMTVKDVETTLGSTVKRDNRNKVISLLIMLLNYTHSDQQNVGFLAESSSGKSYIPLEISAYFPRTDVKKLGYASPTAFFHEQGEWKIDPEDDRDVEDEKKHKIKIINLRQKILIFLDMPHDLLLQRLRSLLSHDEREIAFEITDKSQKFGLATKKVVIQGFPTVLFCSAKYGMQEQERTRLLLLSPEITQEKLRESIQLKIEKEADREAYEKRLLEDPRRRLLADRIESIRSAHINHVKMPEDLKDKVTKRFMAEHRFLIPRNQRDVSRLLAIIKGHALLNLFDRTKVGDSLFVNQQDVDEGFELYKSISEANELGLSPELYTVFQTLKNAIENKENGISITEFQTEYYKEFHKPLGYESAKKILKTLAAIGLLTQEIDPVDRRLQRYMLFDLGVKAISLPPTAEAYIFPSPGASLETPVTLSNLDTVKRALERTCGQCAIWHKPSCSFPDSEYTCVTPTNAYAADCKDFTEKPLLEGTIPLIALSDVTKKRIEPFCDLCIERHKTQRSQIKDVGRVDEFGVHFCCLCSSFSETCWRAILVDGRQLPLCETCREEFQSPKIMVDNRARESPLSGSPQNGMKN
jgi:hypothetical protein